jgi:hypothetical protein
METADIDIRAAASIIEPARTYVALLEEAEELSRSGELLTPPPPAHVVTSLRRWFVHELAAQLLDGAEPSPPGAECLVP